jgi:hypothetical protein
MPRKIRKHPACPQRQCATVSHTGDPGPEAEGLTLRGPLGFVPATLRLLATLVSDVPATSLTSSSDFPSGRGFSSSAESQDTSGTTLDCGPEGVRGQGFHRPDMVLLG